MAGSRGIRTRHQRGALLLLGAALLAPPGALAASLADTVEAVRPSIVGVGTYQATRRPPGTFGGTGFVVGNGRYAITNSHVVPEVLDGANREFLAVLAGTGKGELRRAELVRRDPVHDLALLRFDGAPLPALRLGDSTRVREGELYAFTGFPIGIVIGMHPVTHRGIVSAITPIAIAQGSTRSLSAHMIQMLRQPYDIFQLDATAYPGNSGSPLYDSATGEVVGVVNMTVARSTKESALPQPTGIAYAVPVRYLAELIADAGP